MKTNRTKRLPSTDASLLKQINYARILSILRRNPHLPRAEIARQTGLTRSTVTVITGELIDKGLVIEELDSAVIHHTGGRPGVGLTLNPEGAFFIGASIESENLTVIEMNLSAQVVSRVQEPIVEQRDPETVLSQLVKLIQQVRSANPLSQERLRGIGLTVPGTLNLEGVVIRAPRLDWQNIDLRSHLEAHIDLPLFVDNDANAAALAEVYLGSAIECSSLLYLLLDLGVGGGIVIDNRVYRGAYGTASEVSDLLVDPRGTRSEHDVQSGTMGVLVGKVGLLERYRDRTNDPTVDLNHLLTQLQDNEAIAQSVVQEWAQFLGWGLTSLVNVLNPERVVLGGQLTVLLPYVKNQLDAMLRDCVRGTGIYGFFSNAKSRFEISEFGEDSAAIGAAVLSYQSLFQVPDLVLLQR
jgi:predicted NBD/HSP70 family sugar kinase